MTHTKNEIVANVEKKPVTESYNQFINTIVRQHQTRSGEKKIIAEHLGPNKAPLKKISIKNKTDISHPQNFLHVAHVGFNEKSGFEYHGESPILKQILQLAGLWNEYVCFKNYRDHILQTQ